MTKLPDCPAAQGLTEHDAAALRRAIHHALHDGSPGVLLHRLHALLLVGLCGSARAAAKAGGDSPRSMQRWCRRWREHGADGLLDLPRRGRPGSLSDDQLELLRARVLERERLCAECGAPAITASPFKATLEHEFKRRLSLRQCRRLLVHLRAESVPPTVTGPASPQLTDVWPVDTDKPSRQAWM